MAYINGSETLFSAELHEGVDVEIVQETGESTTAVMSQKASTESFVPKVTSTSEFDRVYFVNTKGTQALINIGVGYPHANTLVARQNGGQIQTGTPTEDRHAVTLKYANEHYVQITSNNSGIMQVFAQNTDGTTTKVGINTSATDYSIARRYTDGRLKVAPPVLAEDATPRSYVDAVYRHDITFEGGFDYNGTTGYMACTVYSRNNTAWDYSGYECTLTGRATATGIINTLDGETHTIVGFAKGEDSVSYYIYYLNEDFSVGKFDFYDGEGTFTDTVTQMI